MRCRGNCRHTCRSAEVEWMGGVWERGGLDKATGPNRVVLILINICLNRTHPKVFSFRSSATKQTLNLHWKNFAEFCSKLKWVHVFCDQKKSEPFCVELWKKKPAILDSTSCFNRLVKTFAICLIFLPPENKPCLVQQIFLFTFGNFAVQHKRALWWIFPNGRIPCFEFACQLKTHVWHLRCQCASLQERRNISGQRSL